MKAKFLMVALTAAVLLAGCSAPRGLNHQATRPVAENLDEPQSDVVRAFAASAGQLKPGQTVSLNLPEGGEGTVSLARTDTTYKNALGETCRHVEMKRKRGESTRAAVCRTMQGDWRYVPMQGL